MASIEASPRGLPHPKKPKWRPSFQRRLECPKSGHGCLGRVKLILRLHQECPGVMKLVMQLYYVSQGAIKGSSEMVELVCRLHHVGSDGDQRKFLSSGVSAWTSL